MTRTIDPRITELLDLAETEGIRLPYPPEIIIRQEDLGHVVDLRTGTIISGEADTTCIWTLTSEGETLVRVLKGKV